MLLVAGCALIVFWLLCVFIFKVTKGLIHIALIIAVVAIIVHLLRAR